MDGKDFGRKDRESFISLFSRRENYENIAFSYIHDRDAAKDIVNDAFVHLWEKRDEIDWSDNPSGYIYLGVRSRCISWLRKQQTSRRANDEMDRAGRFLTESSIAVLGDGGSSSRILHSEVQSLMRKALENMPELTRNIFFASRSEGATYSEIASRFGITQRRVAAEIQRALAHMRKSLHDYL